MQPLDFIPLAEETGLILPIGQWVLCQACRTMAAWEADPRLAGLGMAVNVSARQFHQPDFVHNVREQLRALENDLRHYSKDHSDDGFGIPHR